MSPIALIAFVTYGFDSESHLLMLTGAENEAKSHGYQVILNYVQSYEEEIEVLNRLKGESICGVLLWPNAAASSGDPQAAAGYQEIRLPIVVMDRQISGIDCDCVTSENYAGAKALMTHLIDMGHERIIFLTHQENHLLPVKQRYEAYVDAMREAQLEPAEPWRVGAPGDEIHATDALRASVDSEKPRTAANQKLLAERQSPPNRDLCDQRLHRCAGDAVDAAPRLAHSGRHFARRL